MKSTAKSECILGGLPWEGHWAHQEKHVLLWKCQKMTTLSANSEIQFLIFQGRLAAGPENKHSSHAKSTLLETRPAPTRAMAAASEKSATTKVTRRDSFLCARTVLQNAPSQNHPFRLHKTPTSKKRPLETPCTKGSWAHPPKDEYRICKLKMTIFTMKVACKFQINLWRAPLGRAWGASSRAGPFMEMSKNDNPLDQFAASGPEENFDPASKKEKRRLNLHTSHVESLFSGEPCCPLFILNYFNRTFGHRSFSLINVTTLLTKRAETEI